MNEDMPTLRRKIQTKIVWILFYIKCITTLKSTVVLGLSCIYPRSFPTCVRLETKSLQQPSRSVKTSRVGSAPKIRQPK